MVVESLRPATASFPAAGTGAAGRPAPPVIDARTIKAILYLGLKGDVALAPAGDGKARGPGRGVDTYA